MGNGKIGGAYLSRLVRVTSLQHPSTTLPATSPHSDDNGQLGTHCNDQPVVTTDSDTMGKMADAVLSPLVFNRYPVSILAALLYGLVFASVLFSDSLPRVKYSEEFDQAVTDLTKVRQRVVGCS